MDNVLHHTVEAQFHGVSNAQALRQLHRQGDWNALLEYALLLCEQEASQRSQIQWLVREAAARPAMAIQSWHVELARELLEPGSQSVGTRGGQLQLSPGLGDRDTAELLGGADPVDELLSGQV